MSSKKGKGPRWGPKFSIQLKNEFEKLHKEDPPKNKHKVHPLINTPSFRDGLFPMFKAQGFDKAAFNRNYRTAISQFSEELKMSGARARNIFDDKMDSEGEEDEEDENDEEDKNVKANASVVKKGKQKDMTGIEEKMSLLGIVSGKVTNDDIAIPNVRVINFHNSEARILVGVPLLVDPKTVKITLGSDLKSIRVDYPVSKKWMDGNSLYKTYVGVDKVCWVSKTMAGQYDAPERKSRKTFGMTITSPFRIGKYKQEIISLQRDKKEKQMKKKEQKKLEEEIRQLGGWINNDLPSDRHKDWKTKKQKLTEVKTHLEEIKTRKHYMIELHIVSLDKDV
jgi:hypothetical protein